jgi:hypothetical protein
MKTIPYGSSYLRLLRQARAGRALYVALVKTARHHAADAEEIAEAVYWFASEWYIGQRDPLYAVLSVCPFRPGCLARGPQSVVSSAIYDALITVARRHGY